MPQLVLPAFPDCRLLSEKKKKAVEKVTSHSLGDAAASCVSSPQLPKEKEPQLGRTQPLMQRPPVIMDFR